MSRIKLPTRINARQANNSSMNAFAKQSMRICKTHDIKLDENQKDWRNTVKELVEQRGYTVDSSGNPDQDLQIESLDNLEILMDFEQQYPDIYSEVDDIMFGKCKTFAEMIKLIERYMK